jgi:transposase
MSYTIQLSKAEIALIAEKKRKEKNGKLLRRYQCLSMLHEQYPKKEIARLLGVNIDTITDWIKIYNRDGMDGLTLLRYEGRRPSSLDSIKEKIIDSVEKENISTLSQLQKIIKKKHHLKVEHSWLSRYCKKNSISLIRKQD